MSHTENKCVPGNIWFCCSKVHATNGSSIPLEVKNEFNSHAGSDSKFLIRCHHLKWTGFPTTFIYLFCVLFCFRVFIFLIDPLYTTHACFDVMATLLPCIPKNWDMHHYTAYILKEIWLSTPLLKKDYPWRNSSAPFLMVLFLREEQDITYDNLIQESLAYQNHSILALGSVSSFSLSHLPAGVDIYEQKTKLNSSVFGYQQQTTQLLSLIRTLVLL